MLFLFLPPLALMPILPRPGGPLPDTIPAKVSLSTPRRRPIPLVVPIAARLRQRSVSLPQKAASQDVSWTALRNPFVAQQLMV